MRSLWFVCWLVLVSVTANGQVKKFDVVIYGGTAGGVITAVAAAREGLKVALLEPRDHLGGMVSSGLGRTDFGKKEVIGGYSLEFFQRVGKKYGEGLAWYFEPRVAEEVYKELAKEAGVTVLYQHRLKEKTGVKKQGARLIEIVMENGARFQAQIFADCTYEGDLMAQAKVSYTFGREGSAEYGESLAGVRDRTPKHQFLVRRDWKDPKSEWLSVNISPYDDKGRLLPEIYSGKKGAAGEADKKVQAYNFRMCLTDDPNNQVPIPKSKNYDPRRYELLARFIKKAEEVVGRKLELIDVMDPGKLGRNRKLDVNNNGAFSTDYIGGSWNYPDGDYKTRERIWQEHIDYIAGFFYFLQHDPQVPIQLQNEAKKWALAKDEFPDTNHWPHQLYVREARRMVGEFVMSQKDIQTELTKTDVIGMGSYNSDSHNIQRIVNDQGFVENEGDMQVPVTPYQIPYRLILPKRTEATNLLVPVAFSATHVAYSTLRMEPQYMIIGQAAGVAARMAIEKKAAVQDIDAAALTAKLRSRGAVLEWQRPSAGSPPKL
ncbi:MAG: FAD-dependent oxidoreductase [Acidobacteria bacterium]|nr:FAD-dependent oxidoreductase [Acidobacteriota bacterium]